jgi:N-acetylneuraminic acid mutarotase
VNKLLVVAGLIVVGVTLGFVVAGRDSQSAVSLGPAPTVRNSTTTSITRTGTAPTARALEVWFTRGEQLVPQLRTHAPTPRVAKAALTALLAGPTKAERSSGLTSAIPDRTRLLSVSIRNGVATVDLTSQYQSGGGSLSMQVRLAQVVYTLTQFPTVKKVRFALDGSPVNVFSDQGIVLDHPVDRSDYRGLSMFGSQLAGSWRKLPASPIKPDSSFTSVWTGTQMIVVGRDRLTALDARGNPYSRGAVNVAAAYDPADNTWRRLPSPGPMGSFMDYGSAWTGKEMLVWGAGTREAYNPATNTWRKLPSSPLLAIHDGFGLVAWTGRELIGWGGGCCGDAFSDGVAYNPATNLWHKLPRSPLPGSQRPVGAWTGKELVVFVGNLNPDGKLWPARLARAAAYNPATNSWRRIAPLPAPRTGASAAWDGREVLVVGGAGEPRAGKPAPLATVGFAYNPAANSWRRLPPMESGRFGAAAVWTGTRLLLWGGSQTADAGPPVIPPHGLAYDPKANRWSALPQAPLEGRLDPTALWTGSSMIVWGGEKPALPAGSGTKSFTDGASFTP